MKVTVRFAAILLVASALSPALPARAATPAPLACDTTQGGCWRPTVNSRWQYQLQGIAAYASTGGINVNISAVPFTRGAPVSPSVFNFDLYVDRAIAGDNTTLNTAGVNAVHAKEAKAICYVSAGTWEDWRPDANQFPASVRGQANGWPGERWLDIRQTSILLPIMKARVLKCRQAGFDGVEFDNVDGYSNKTGFPLTAQHQLTYNASLANLAHEYGLTAALKNDVEQVPALARYFDYAVNEQCQQYSECGDYDTFFTALGKAVFQVEYKDDRGKKKTSKSVAKASGANFCTSANAANRNAILKDLRLFDMPYTPCR